MSSNIIHHIKGNTYLYRHYRVDDRVVCDYIGAIGSNGNIRQSLHGGGAPVTVADEITRKLVDSAEMDIGKRMESAARKLREKI